MKVWIIEDERELAQSLSRQLRQLRSDVSILGISSNISESIAAIRDNQDLDIIFADIKIDDGVSFSVFDAVETLAMVVFTTAYDEYALKAFEYNCADYLLKPILADHLERALIKCERREKRLRPASLKTMVADIVQGKVEYRKRVLLKTLGNGTLICPVQDMVYVFTEQGYTRVFIDDGSFAVTDLSLKDLMDGLNPAQFCRISRQAIINIDFVKTITPGPGRDTCVSLRSPFEKVSLKMAPERAKELLSLIDS